MVFFCLPSSDFCLLSQKKGFCLMDENGMRVLQMLQEGKISATEAETLIAALRGESATAATGTAKPEEKKAEGEDNRAKFKPPKVDFDDLGKKISEAVA